MTTKIFMNLDAQKKSLIIYDTNLRAKGYPIGKIFVVNLGKSRAILQ
jgi:hypothetical protein